MGDKLFCFLNISEVNKKAFLSSIYWSNTLFSIFGSLNVINQIDLSVVCEAFSCVSRTVCVGICLFQIMKSAVACLCLKPAVLQTHLGAILFNGLFGGYTDPFKDLDRNPCVPSRCCFMSLISHLFLIWTSFLLLPPPNRWPSPLQEGNDTVMKNVSSWNRGNLTRPLFLCQRPN